MVGIAESRPTSVWDHITARPNLYCLLTAGLFTLLLVFLEFGLRTIYIQAYPQDFFLELDGIYRLSMGQRIYTEFSTPFGLALYGIPLLFVHSSSDIVLSINYATGLYLIVGFLIVAYLTLTRLSPVLGLALGVWIALALASRMVTGGSPTIVTLAGNYNRTPEAALAMALLLCRVPRNSRPILALTDGLIYACLTAFAFYTKITYGLVALTFGPVLIYPHRHRLVMAFAFVAATGLLVLAVEYGYGTRFHWLQPVQMMLLSGNSAELSPIVQVLFINLATLLICILIPLWFLWREQRLTLWALIFGAMVVGGAILLTRSNGSYDFTFLPAILFFVVAPTALPWPADRSARARQEWPRYVLMAITLTLVTLDSGPEFSNLVIASYRSLTEPPMIPGHDVLGRIVIRSRPGIDLSAPGYKAILDGQAKAIDAFAIGRAIRPIMMGDDLTMAEFRDYLTDGMQAAQEGCKPESRILTLDLANPFPLLLSWPEGGGMVVIHPDRFVSKRAHLPPDQMFKNIDCVLVPKLPVQMIARDFLLDTYGSFLSQQFPVARDTQLWTVLRKPD